MAAKDWREYVTDLPHHLQYRAPVLPDQFEHIEPKYMQSSKRDEKVAMLQRQREEERRSAMVKTASPTKHRHVSPRYMSGIHRTSPAAARTGVATPTRTQSVAHTPEYLEHKRRVQTMGLGHIEPKYMQTPRQDSAMSPLDAVRQQKRDNPTTRGGSAWRAGTPGRGDGTFRSMERSNDRLKLWNTPTRQRPGMTSKVMEYIRRDTTASPYQSPPPPQRSQTPTMGGKVFRGAGGAGNGTYQRMGNSPKRPQVAKEEDIVRTVRSHLRSTTPPTRTSPTRASATFLQPTIASRGHSPSNRTSPTQAEHAASGTSPVRPPYAFGTSSRGHPGATPKDRGLQPLQRQHTPTKPALPQAARQASPGASRAPATARPRSPPYARGTGRTSPVSRQDSLVTGPGPRNKAGTTPTRGTAATPTASGNTPTRRPSPTARAPGGSPVRQQPSSARTPQAYSPLRPGTQERSGTRGAAASSTGRPVATEWDVQFSVPQRVSEERTPSPPPATYRNGSATPDPGDRHTHVTVSSVYRCVAPAPMVFEPTPVPSFAKYLEVDGDSSN